MCSGKSDRLIKLIHECGDKGLPFLVLKHTQDTRSGCSIVRSRNGDSCAALNAAHPRDILVYVGRAAQRPHTVFIDEIQFFALDGSLVHILLDTIKELLDHGICVVVAGLDLDFKREPFPATMHLMPLAHKIYKLSADCVPCGAEAFYTQRLDENGDPVPYNDPLVVVGDRGYEPRCGNCHDTPGAPNRLVSLHTIIAQAS